MIMGQLSLQDSDFLSLEYLPRNGVTGSYVNIRCNFFEHLHTVIYSHSLIYILTSSVQGVLPLHILTNTYLLLLMKAIVTGM